LVRSAVAYSHSNSVINYNVDCLIWSVQSVGNW
jgi:hypothetical protein